MGRGHHHGVDLLAREQGLIRRIDLRDAKLRCCLAGCRLVHIGTGYHVDAGHGRQLPEVESARNAAGSDDPYTYRRTIQLFPVAVIHSTTTSSCPSRTVARVPSRVTSTSRTALPT